MKYPLHMTAFVLVRRHDFGADSDFMVFGTRNEVDSLLRDYIHENCEDDEIDPPDLSTSDAIDAYLAEHETIGRGSWWVLQESYVTFGWRELRTVLREHATRKFCSWRASIKYRIGKLCRVN